MPERSSHRVWLYAVVFSSRFSVSAVLLLFLSFLVQPINQAMAAEDESIAAVTEEVVADEVREQTEEEQNSETEEAVVNDVSSTPEIENLNEPETSPEETAAVESDEVPSELTEQTESPVLTNESTSTATSSNPDSSDSSQNNDSVDDNASESVDDVIVEPEDNEESSDFSNEDLTSTSSDDVVVQAQNLVTEDNFYQFSRQSCVLVGNGTYHCSVSEATTFDTQSVAYAAADVDGDMEIYLRTSRGGVRQITDNDFDDTAPHYDAGSLQVVWQRLIDDRYQIITYDIVSDKESQLTYSRTNNMEPKISEEGVVWQAWDNNDWEIMYFDGSYTEQITDNVVQDVNPVIQDGYILWSVIGRSSQEAKVYSLTNNEIMTITGHEGGTIVNPRFVLVYDTQFDNGDVITQGFDPVTGISAPIAAKPAPEPVNIPPIDPVGEIRALIQNKSTSEEEQEFTDVPSGNDGTLSLATDSTSASSSDTTLDLTTPQPTVVMTPTSSIMLSEYDLVIVPTTSTSTIEDSTQD